MRSPILWEHEGNYLYWCPGCKMGHCIPAKPVKEERVWQFDGNFDCPTFSPSVRHFLTDPETKQEKTTCHYIIEKGMIKYQGDCEHKLSGQTIPMQNIPEDYGFN